MYSEQAGMSFIRHTVPSYLHCQACCSLQHIDSTFSIVVR